MQISCPNCKTRFNLDEARVGDQGVKLRCSRCKVVFKVVKRVSPVSNAGQPLRQAASRVKVLVANESQPFCAAVCKLLSTEPFDVTAFHDGRSAMDAIEAERPAIALLDVALPGMCGSEICAAVRSNPDLSPVRLILTASVYDRTRYKKSPDSLGGADAYLEKHHIPDSLIPMIYRLLAGEPPQEDKFSVPVALPTADGTVAVWTAAGQEVIRHELRQDEVRSTTVAGELPPDQAEAHLKARRLARIIVSDIFLYNQAKAEEGIRNGRFYEVMAEDIREGRSLYMKRVHEDVSSRTSYLDEAFEHMLARKRLELNL